MLFEPLYVTLPITLSITTIRCNSAIAIHGKQMHKEIILVVNPGILVTHCLKFLIKNL
jgi:hypothetical protein